MQERVRKFYRGERISNAVFLSFGISSSVIACIYHLVFNSSLSLGLMIALGSVGIFQFFHGLYRFWQTFKYYEKAIKSIHANDGYIRNTENSRLIKLDRQYLITRNVESILFLICFVIMVVCTLTKNPGFLFGAAVGITFHSAVMLVFDLLSQFRVREYMYQIGKL